MADFGRTAGDYARHRMGFPPAFFDRLETMGVIRTGHRALDLGTGTGTLARGLAARGLNTTGLDRSPALLAEARRLGTEEGLAIEFVEARAEASGFADGRFDVITAGQCWHWFDRSVVGPECHRMLRSDGRLVIAHLDWLPFEGNVVELTEKMIAEFGAKVPKPLSAANEGLYPAWTRDVKLAGFDTIETFSVRRRPALPV